MLASKQAAKKKEAARQAKKQARDAAATQALQVWEKEILPNWKSVLRKDNLRQVWWSGTMPPRYRARFWQSCIGNSLVLGKSECLTRFKAFTCHSSCSFHQHHMRKLWL